MISGVVLKFPGTVSFEIFEVRGFLVILNSNLKISSFIIKEPTFDEKAGLRREIDVERCGLFATSERGKSPPAVLRVLR